MMSLPPKEQRQKLKQDYGWLYKAFVQLLARHDPMNLVRVGAPSSEYEPEVDVILLRLQEAKSSRSLGSIVYEAFAQCFGSTFALLDQPPSKQKETLFETIGEDAWYLWERWVKEKEI